MRKLLTLAACFCLIFATFSGVAAAADESSGSTAKSTGWSFAGLSTGYYYQSADFERLDYGYAVNGVTFTTPDRKSKPEVTEHGVSIAASAGYTMGSSERFSWGIQVEPEVMIGSHDVETGENYVAGANAAAVVIEILQDRIDEVAADLTWESILPRGGGGLDGLVTNPVFTVYENDRHDDESKAVRRALQQAAFAAHIDFVTNPRDGTGQNSRLEFRQVVQNQGWAQENFTAAFFEAYITELVDPDSILNQNFEREESQRIGALLEFAQAVGREFDVVTTGVASQPGRVVRDSFSEGLPDANGNDVFNELPVTSASDFEEDNNGQSIVSLNTESPTLVHITLPVYAVANMHSERFNANFGVGTGVMFYDVGNELSDGKAWPILAKTEISVPVNDRVSVGGGLRFHYSLASSGDIDSIWGIRADALVSYSF